MILLDNWLENVIRKAFLNSDHYNQSKRSTVEQEIEYGTNIYRLTDGGKTDQLCTSQLRKRDLYMYSFSKYKL